ncbi:MAG: WD40 repeat domain-containing protein [Gemmataceae bacterium]|nr:WD40 repeat domain-containing protein [Gemmataceae bacterium]
MSLTRAGLLVLLALPLPAAAQPEPPKGKATPAPSVDRFGDPLPPGAVGRLGTTRFRHVDPVRFIGYAADGKLLLSASDSTLYFWEAKTGKPVRQIPLKGSSLPFRPMSSVLLSGDGKTLVVGTNSSCTVYDAATGKQLRAFTFEGGPRMLSRDGRLLLTFPSFPPGGFLGGFPGGIPGGLQLPPVKVFDTTTGKPVLELPPYDKEKGGTFTAATLAPDGKTLVTVEMHGLPPGGIPGGIPGNEQPKARLRFHNVAARNEVRTLTVPMRFVSQLEFSPDGKTLAVSNFQEQELHLLEAATGKEQRKLPVKANMGYTLLFSRDSKQLFVAGFDSVTQFDLQTGREVRKYPRLERGFGGFRGGIPGVGFGGMGFGGGFPGGGLYGGFGGLATPALSPDGRTLVLPALATLARWDIQTGKQIPGDEGHLDWINSVAFAPKGDRVLVGGGDGALALWDVGTTKRVRGFERKKVEEKELRQPGWSPGFGLVQVRGAFAPDGKTLAGLWYGGDLHVWDADTGKLRHHLTAPGGHSAFAYSPDGRYAATNGPGGSVRLWDLTTGKSVRQFIWHKDLPQPLGGIFGFGGGLGGLGGFGGMGMGFPGGIPGGLHGGTSTTGFSADGRVVFGGMLLYGQLAVVTGWEVTGGRERWRFEANALERDALIVSFLPSPDGRLMALAGSSSIHLLDPSTGKEVRTFGGLQVDASTAVFSPDGKLLLAGKPDGSIRIWDVATGTVVQDFPAHPSAVTALAFSADGKLLASGANDTTVLLWDWEYVRRQAQTSKPAALGRAEALWKELTTDDATKAYQVMQTLIATPAETVTLLKGHLKPVPPVQAGRLERLIADLDLNFRVREKAEKELLKLGDLATKAMRDTLANPPSQEVRIRLEGLLTKLEGAVVSPELLRDLRAVEVLERIGTVEARTVLEALSRGTAGHRVTEDARRSLERLSKRAAAP